MTEARLLLARALLADKQVKECLKTLAASNLDEVSAENAPRLDAQRLRLQGEARFISDDLPEAERALADAAAKFGEIGAVWSQADAQLLLGTVQLKAGRRVAAQLALLAAIDVFQRCGDRRNADRALALLMGSAGILTVSACGAVLRCRLRRLRRA